MRIKCICCTLAMILLLGITGCNNSGDEVDSTDSTVVTTMSDIKSNEQTTDEPTENSDDITTAAPESDVASDTVTSADVITSDENTTRADDNDIDISDRTEDSDIKQYLKAVKPTEALMSGSFISGSDNKINVELGSEYSHFGWMGEVMYDENSLRAWISVESEDEKAVYMQARIILPTTMLPWNADISTIKFTGLNVYLDKSSPYTIDGDRVLLNAVDFDIVLKPAITSAENNSISGYVYDPTDKTTRSFNVTYEGDNPAWYGTIDSEHECVYKTTYSAIVAARNGDKLNLNIEGFGADEILSY